MAKPAFFRFTKEDNAVWAKLYHKQRPMVEQYAHSMYLQGFDMLDFPAQQIPDFEALDKLFQARVGWELVSTNVQYSSDKEWFEALAERDFLITEYVRSLDALDYTPLPDIWHDSFGHLPFLVHQLYADYLQKFSEVMNQFTPEQRTGLASIWWYSIEFGLMMENGKMKAFGAGLMSSYEEMRRAFSGEVDIIPFDMSMVTHIPASPHEMHNKLFLYESFEQLDAILDEWHRLAKQGEPMGY